MTKNELRVPTTGPGFLVLRKWHVANHANVRIGSTLCEIDGDAPCDFGTEMPEGGAYLDLISDWNGNLEIAVPEGSEVSSLQVIAYIVTND